MKTHKRFFAESEFPSYMEIDIDNLNKLQFKNKVTLPGPKAVFWNRILKDEDTFFMDYALNDQDAKKRAPSGYEYRFYKGKKDSYVIAVPKKDAQLLNLITEVTSKNESVELKEGKLLKDYMNPPKDLYKGEEAKMGAKDLKLNLDSAFNQLTETVIRVMAEQSEFLAPGLFNTFLNEIDTKILLLKSEINKQLRELNKR